MYSVENPAHMKKFLSFLVVALALCAQNTAFSQDDITFSGRFSWEYVENMRGGTEFQLIIHNLGSSELVKYCIQPSNEIKLLFVELPQGERLVRYTMEEGVTYNVTVNIYNRDSGELTDAIVKSIQIE